MLQQTYKIDFFVSIAIATCIYSSVYMYTDFNMKMYFLSAGYFSVLYMQEVHGKISNNFAHAQTVSACVSSQYKPIFRGSAAFDRG